MPRIQFARLRRAAFVLALVLLLIAGTTTTDRTAAAAPGDTQRYIVVLEEGSLLQAATARLEALFELEPEILYRHAIEGFTVRLPAEVAELLASHPDVASVERDSIVSAAAETVPDGINRVDAVEEASITGSGPGVDVDIAIVDGGIDTDHPDLNVVGGRRFLDPASPQCGDGTGSIEDENGHGTQVAGVAAAMDTGTGIAGMAPGARLHAVKVLDGSGNGTASCLVAAIDWLVANAGVFEVANMSLTGASNPAVCSAVAGAVAAGITVVAAAGNKSINVASTSPANCPQAVTVSAFADSDGAPGGAGPQVNGNDDDSFASFSNFGPAIDIAAPGVAIFSTSLAGGYATASGTSFATPHVSGALALHIADGGIAAAADVDDLTGRGWTTPQSGGCGFSDDPDTSPEPALYLGSCGINAPPAADAGGPYAGAPGIPVQFSGTGSDSDGSVTLFEWDFDFDGSFAVDQAGATLRQPSHAYAAAGNYIVALRVTDDDGATDIDSATVDIDAPPPWTSERGCDFDGVAGTDLAAGVPGEDLAGPVANAGAVNLIRGSAAGLGAGGSQWWDRRSVATIATNDGWGATLTCGDFNGDGYGDLVVGGNGTVDVLYGSTQGLTTAGSDSFAVSGHDGDGLAAGDFDGDGHDDLVIGASGYDVAGRVDAGALWVAEGSPGGLAGVLTLWHQSAGSISGASEAQDRFGRAVAVGDFDGDGRDDVAVGVPGEALGSKVGAGMVNVIYGSAAGLTDAGNQGWHQDSNGIGGAGETGDAFGAGLA